MRASCAIGLGLDRRRRVADADPAERVDAVDQRHVLDDRRRLGQGLGEDVVCRPRPGASWLRVPSSQRTLPVSTRARRNSLTAFGVSPLGSTETATICMLDGSQRALRGRPSACSISGQTSGQCGVDERHEDGLAAQRRELEELAVLVVQRDLRGDRSEATRAAARKLAGLPGDRRAGRRRHHRRRSGRAAALPCSSPARRRPARSASSTSAEPPFAGLGSRPQGS